MSNNNEQRKTAETIAKNIRDNVETGNQEILTTLLSNHNVNSFSAQNKKLVQDALKDALQHNYLLFITYQHSWKKILCDYFPYVCGGIGSIIYGIANQSIKYYSGEPTTLSDIKIGRSDNYSKLGYPILGLSLLAIYYLWPLVKTSADQINSRVEYLQNAYSNISGKSPRDIKNDLIAIVAEANKQYHLHTTSREPEYHRASASARLTQ